nr:polysaccharide deacetylase family protein [Clostridium paridis]
MENKTKLPPNSMMLTFDDGFIDHYTNVFPILSQNKISGSFYVPAEVLSCDKVLDVHKIHYILASTSTKTIMKDLFSLLNFYRGKEFEFDSNESIYSKLALIGRFDDKDTIFIKRLLQVELPEKLRGILVNELFKKYIAIDEESFSKELYISYDQIKLMKKCGMHFGIHGYRHYWLEKLHLNEAKTDIRKSLDFYSDIIDSKSWTISYPYGSRNEELVEFVKSANCKVGLTTEVRIANLSKDCMLNLPRLDTNDFPPKSNNYLNHY